MVSTYAANCAASVSVAQNTYKCVDLEAQAKKYGVELRRLPYSLRVLLENLLRHLDGSIVTEEHIRAFADWLKNPVRSGEVAFRPARVLMQDFTGVPAVVDLAAMRDAMLDLRGDPAKINPLSPVDLVIDHSVQVDYFGTSEAFKKNVQLEMRRNVERYELLRSAQKMFSNFRVIPPGTGICHQVNLEYLAKVVWSKEEGGARYAYPDAVVGTDSHTTMINGLGVLGWGVGGIEAESAMLGQPISMTIPEVVGFEITGETHAGVTATDVVLTVTEMLRKKGVVDKFVEFFGAGLDRMALADRATVANMAPEYGATCGFFPIDAETIRYMKLTGRDAETVELAEKYARQNALWRDDRDAVVYSSTLSLDLSTVEPSIAGPTRPQDRISLKNAATNFSAFATAQKPNVARDKAKVKGENYELEDGAVVIAAITSCTNTSNPGVMLAAGMVAKKAREKGLTVKPWVKTSLAPGSQVVSGYLENSGLQDDLNALGFYTVGYGCTTCIGNSGPLDDHISDAIKEKNLLVNAVLSGNRNFEGRVHALTRGNFLASPPLVVAYALAGNMYVDLTKDSLGKDAQGNDVYLKDIWPTPKELKQVVEQTVTAGLFKQKYADVFAGDAEWQAIKTTESDTYNWSDASTYIKKPPYFDGLADGKREPGLPVRDARILALLGDSVTTDHISPAGNIAPNTPAAKFLRERGVDPEDFNSYGARRGNDDVMVRGTFANIRIRNEMAAGSEGGVTDFQPTGERMSIYDAAMCYKEQAVPLLVVAGKDYGMGSSRDWAAKGARLLGVRAVIAESFERIHRSNLIGMGVLPLEFTQGQTRRTLGLTGRETVELRGESGGICRSCAIVATFTDETGLKKEAQLLCRIDTPDELEYFQNGGILHKVLRDLAA
ncbi:MAG: aconitate hydratase AcnA [Rickettsiales bacterium]